MSLTSKAVSAALPALLLVLFAAACGSNGDADADASQEIADPLARPTAETDVTRALSDFAEEAAAAEATVAGLEGESEPEAIAAVKVGRDVGERVLDFSITLEDGSVQTSAEMVAAGRPVFMFFFTTW